MKKLLLAAIAIGLGFGASGASASVVQITVQIQTQMLTQFTEVDQVVTSESQVADDQTFTLDFYLDEAGFELIPRSGPDRTEVNSGRSEPNYVNLGSNPFEPLFAAQRPGWTDPAQFALSAQNGSARVYPGQVIGLNADWGDYFENDVENTPGLIETTRIDYNEVLRLNVFNSVGIASSMEPTTFMEMIGVYEQLMIDNEEIDFSFDAREHHTLDIFDLNGTGLSSFTETTTAFRYDGIAQITAITVVPIPAAVWLFGSALAGLGFLRRRT